MTQPLTDVIAEAIYTAMGEIAGEDDTAEQFKDLPEGPREEILSLSSAVLQAIDQAGYKIIPEIRHESAQGRTIEEMRANISPAMLGAGDAKLMWVNEGDLLMLYMPPAMLSASKEGITK